MTSHKGKGGIAEAAIPPDGATQNWKWIEPITVRGAPKVYRVVLADVVAVLRVLK